MKASSRAGSAPAFVRRRVLAAAILLAVPWVAGCAAQPPEGRDVAGRWIDLQVLDRDGGGDLRVWRHGGESWVAGTPGARYALRLSNRSGERLLAIVSVDGINIVTGETAGTRQRGYVLEPWQTAELTGWRKSDSEVAAFEFTRLDASYAARTGRPDDVGVVGLAVYRERPRPLAAEQRAAPRAEEAPTIVTAVPPSRQPAPTAATADRATAAPPQPSALAKSPAPSADAMAAAGALPRARLGTGHGARETSWISTVAFERASETPEETLHVRYDRLDNLVAAGIVPRSVAWSQARPPRAFPADADGYVPDPPSR